MMSLVFSLTLTNKSVIELRIWKGHWFENNLKYERDLRWWCQWMPIWGVDADLIPDADLSLYYTMHFKFYKHILAYGDSTKGLPLFKTILPTSFHIILELVCERSDLFMVKNVYLGFSSHGFTYWWIYFFLHIVNTFRVTHLYILLMKIFLT
jgi:hypothetical protein